jgi:dihydrofolate reductase
VFSNTLKETENGFVLLNGDIKEKVDHIRKQEGKDIAVWGGASLLASLLNLKLVDEISISFIPVLLGQGKPMVEVLNSKMWLQFKSSIRYGNGTLMVKYAVK